MSESPSDWEIANLGDLTTIKASNVDKKTKEGQKEISLCNYMDVFKNPVVSSALAFMRSTASEKEISEFSLSKGDVLLTKDSEVPEEIGIPSVIADDIPDLVCGYHLYMLRTDRSRINPGYLCWALRSNSSRQYFYQMANGSTRFGLNLKHVEECPIAVPPLPEQKKIAEILSGIDCEIEAIYKRKKKIDLVLQQTIIEATTPHHEAGWREYTIGDVVDFQGGAQPPRATFKFNPEEGYIRMLQIRDFKSDARATYIPLAQCKRFCTSKDVMIGRYGPPNFQILRGKEGSYNVALIKALPRDNEELSRDYLFRFLQRRDLFLLMDSLSQRTSGQQGLDMDALKEFPVFLPDLNTQNYICSSIDSIEAISQGLKRKAQSLNHLKSALSDQLLSGRKRVSV